MVRSSDTIVVQVNGHLESVRQIGVDTHGTKDPLKPVQYFGEEARQFTADLLKGQGDQIEIQAVQTSRDQPYGTAIL